MRRGQPHQPSQSLRGPRPGAATPAEHEALYRQAIAHIATLQVRGAALADPTFIPYTLAFDVEKLMFELQFFATHFLEGYRGAAFSPAARAAQSISWTTISSPTRRRPMPCCPI